MVLHKNEFMTHQAQEITFKQLFSWNFMEYITGRHILFSAKHSELLLGLAYPSANVELMAFLKGVDPCFCLFVCWLKPIFILLCLKTTQHICVYIYVVCTRDIAVVGPLSNMYSWRETFILNT